MGAALEEQGFVPNESLPPEEDAGTVDESPDGSLMVVLATDAPLGSRQLRRLAARALAGVARTNAGAISNGSGDYVVAFSAAESVRRTAARRGTAGSEVRPFPTQASLGTLLTLFACHGRERCPRCQTT